MCWHIAGRERGAGPGTRHKRWPRQFHPPRPCGSPQSPPAGGIKAKEAPGNTRNQGVSTPWKSGFDKNWSESMGLWGASAVFRCLSISTSFLSRTPCSQTLSISHGGILRRTHGIVDHCDVKRAAWAPGNLFSRAQLLLSHRRSRETKSAAHAMTLRIPRPPQEVRATRGL